MSLLLESIRQSGAASVQTSLPRPRLEALQFPPFNLTAARLDWMVAKFRASPAATLALKREWSVEEILAREG